jgi:hypothetical protein
MPVDALLPNVEHDGVHCSLAIRRPASAVAVVVLRGSDIGEFADFPMRELAKDLDRYGAIDLFIDARAVRGASIEVSSEWAFWMRTHARHFRQISMLTGSRYIQITAEFARRFVGLGERMKIFTDPVVFEEALGACVQHACSPAIGATRHA